jgi:AraC-like DNA-binding protein
MSALDRAKPYFKALENRTMTVRTVARLIACNESHLYRALKGKLNKVKSANSVRKSRSKLAKARKEMRERHAFLVKTGQKSLKKAAADAKCSERTIRRYMEGL